MRRDNASDRPPRDGPRRGFTLVELLVVMVVIALLTSMTLAALYSVEESAKISRTKGTIAKIHNAIELRWESYRTRRLPVARGGLNGRQYQAARLRAIWDLQRMEMPDHYDDLVRANYSGTGAVVDPATNALFLAYNQWFTTNGINMSAAAAQNANAEMLYLMVVVGMNSEEEIQLTQREIDDTDDDGVPEIVDGWGRPIRWIRWAPGYLPVVTTYNPLPADTDYQQANLETHGDPFDPQKVGQPGPNLQTTPPGNPSAFGFKLTPLVYSAGADGEYGICPDANYRVPARDWNPYSLYNMSLPNCRGNRWRGAPAPGIEGGGHADNITNHRLGTR